ncbi:response regulator transcription factor [Rhizosphaericola mali]|uniref:Response regulator transcription factor n=1 Tax=Rhizosphaericola mali TaxID=2545455 RepID=A0A5P2FUJ9_9BACT|nr:response regulator transcription factor [Rhizosphaericola mali]QES87136.1 response regulator transcription factor [Rhizosphaericola mali]
MNRLLFVEDEIDLGSVIKQYLEINDFSVEWSTNGKSAFEYFTNNQSEIDLVIIDVSIPEMDGFELAEHINNISDKPFIFLTARKEKNDKIKGLKIGADDYITKPFDIDELVLRLKNILKRNNHVEKNVMENNPALNINNAAIIIGDTEFNKTLLHLNVKGKDITLTLREAELLEYLFAHQNIILKREDILVDLWGKNDYFLGRSLDVFISRLRKYFGKDASIQINNVYGIGFIFKTK